MSDPRAYHVVGDLSGLPDSAKGAHHLVWWGNLGFMLIEGTGFLLAAGAYLYLQSRSPHWPPPGDRVPDLLWGSLFTVGMLISMIPNLWILKRAEAEDGPAVRTWMLAICVLEIGLLALRGVELGHLNVRWDQDAYGSVMWLLMFLHTTHVITEFGDTAVQTLWLYTHDIGADQYEDVCDNSNYWTFVVVLWLPIYGLVYWLPRLS